MQALIHRPHNGLFYLDLAITGALGFLVIPVAALRGRRSCCDTGPASRSTASRWRAPGSRWVLIVLTQALAAIWFYRLFRTADLLPQAASPLRPRQRRAIRTVGGAPRDDDRIAVDPIGDAATVQLLYLVGSNLWGVGALFFGLWLIPMGSCVLRSGWMPRPSLGARRRRHRLRAQRIRPIPRSRGTGRC